MCGKSWTTVISYWNREQKPVQTELQVHSSRSWPRAGLTRHQWHKSAESDFTWCGVTSQVITRCQGRFSCETGTNNDTDSWKSSAKVYCSRRDCDLATTTDFCHSKWQNQCAPFQIWWFCDLETMNFELLTFVEFTARKKTICWTMNILRSGTLNIGWVTARE